MKFFVLSIVIATITLMESMSALHHDSWFLGFANLGLAVLWGFLAWRFYHRYLVAKG